MVKRVRSGNKKGSGGRYVLATVDFLTLILTLVSAVALLLSYLAWYVKPSSTIFFAFVALGAPFLFLTNMILWLYWMVRWRLYALIPVLVLLLGLGRIFTFFNPPFSKNYERAQERGALTILTYNVHGFIARPNGTEVLTMKEVAHYIREVNPDIFCLQEYEYNTRNPIEAFDTILEAWPYKAEQLTINKSKVSGWGLAIYSKYRILNKGGIVFPNSSNSALWADILVRRDTIRIFNDHLQSTQINEEEVETIEHQVAKGELPNEKQAMSIARKLKRNFQTRAMQVDLVSGYIHDSTTSSVIVCGDFNDTPMSYAYRTMRGSLVDPFCKKGRGLVSTYKRFYGLFRIDYIFHSRDFRTVSYEVNEEAPWSDHNPVIVSIKLEK